MKNKIISLSLVAALFIQNVNALDFESTGTSGGSWTDPTSNLTYKSFGNKRYSLKNSTQSYAPWFKGNPPTLKAGCNGISLKGGFIAFMDLEEIGDQLQQAMKSAGMGVIVVLLQTLPSIGKSFENVQKLVRKIQQLQQNMCQITTSKLKNTFGLADTKKDLENDLQDMLGVNYLSSKMKGASDWLDNAMDATNCSSGDTTCEKDVQNKLFKSLFGKKNIYEDLTIGLSIETGKKLSSATGANEKIYIDSLKNLIVDNKFAGNSVNLSLVQLDYMKLKFAIFGILVADRTTSFTSHLDPNDSTKLDKTRLLKYIAENKKQLPISTKITWLAPQNKTKKVVDFITGGEDLSSTNANDITIPGNVNVVQAKYCPESNKNGGCEVKYVAFNYLEPNPSSTTTIKVEWNGIYRNTFKTIMNLIDDKNFEAPTTTEGMFVPNGGKFLKILKSAPNKKKEFIQFYADILSRANVYYALRQLINEVRNEAIQLEITDKKNEAVVNEYLKQIDKKTLEIEKALKEYTAETYRIQDLQQIFNNLDMDIRKEKAQNKRFRGN